MSGPHAPVNNSRLAQFVHTLVSEYLRDMGSAEPRAVYKMIIEEVEPAMIAAVMEHAGGNQSRAATILGITRTTLRQRLRQYGLTDSAS
ncbi:MAG: Fis family transcriptional regulator [Xanthomonadales bacterium]|jgi:Fis family transcriptional regulator|nr:Fis family transcriptional regulator [Xanthomonadales bacterium]